MTSAVPESIDRSRFLDDPRLLEQALMGLGLHELIGELARANDPLLHARQVAPAGAGPGGLLGDDETDVLERGLVALSRPRLEALLDQPGLLLDLQELLLARGGAYWDQVTESLPAPGPVQLSEAQWQERLEQTFLRRPKPQSKLRGDEQPAPAPASGFWARRRGGAIAALLIALALLGVAGGWYRAEARLATARREHADEAASLQSSFDEQLAAVQRDQAGERVAGYCRVLHELSSLPAQEQLVSLPTDDSPNHEDSLPPDEDLVAQEQLPAVEESLVSLSGREQAIGRVADALLQDVGAWAELTRDARRYLEHADPRVGHGAAMALGKNR